MKRKITLIIILFAMTGKAQDVSKEFHYPNFIKNYNLAKAEIANNDALKAKSAITNAQYYGKKLMKSGFETEIQPKLDELDKLLSQGGNSNSVSSTTKPVSTASTNTAKSSSSNSSSSKNITKEFKYPNFVKYQKDAMGFYNSNDVFTTKIAIDNARFAAKALINSGFQSEIQTKLDELVQLEADMDKGATSSIESSENYKTIVFWVNLLDEVYKFKNHYDLDNLNAKFDAHSRVAAFNKKSLLQKIEEIKSGEEYKNSTSTAQLSISSGKTKQRPLKYAGNSNVDRGKVDRLYTYLTNVSKSIDKLDVGKVLSEIRTQSNSSDFDLNYKLINSFLTILNKIDNEDAYLVKISSISKDYNNNKANILKENSMLFGQIKTVGSKSSLPVSAQKNVELDVLLIGTVIMPGNDFKNIIFKDKDWKVNKDNSGNKFSQTLDTWGTFIDRMGNCYIREMSFIQYFDGANSGDILLEKAGNIYTASCDQIESLYVQSGKSKLPTALMTDNNLSTDLMKVASSTSEGYTITNVVLNTKNWGFNHSYGKIVSKSRMAVVTYSNGGKCYYQYHLFKKNYNGSSYGATFVVKKLGEKTMFDCNQLK